MASLLEAPKRPAVRAGGSQITTADAAAIEAAIDRTLHIGGLLARAAAYSLTAAVLAQTDFGPHLLFGLLAGDCTGSLVQARRTFALAPVAVVAELGLFGCLFLMSAAKWSWPDSPELRALLLLGAFAALAARLGWAFGDRRDVDL